MVFFRIPGIQLHHYVLLDGFCAFDIPGSLQNHYLKDNKTIYNPEAFLHPCNIPRECPHEPLSHLPPWIIIETLGNYCEAILLDIIIRIPFIPYTIFYQENLKRYSMNISPPKVYCYFCTLCISNCKFEITIVPNIDL